jgi:hypothetical protein
VLQPLVPAGHSLEGVQQQQSSCSVVSDMRQQTAGASSSSSILALLASSKLPWQQLPSILAANPLLMLKVGPSCQQYMTKHHIT